jgi:hypothetical protein
MGVSYVILETNSLELDMDEKHKVDELSPKTRAMLEKARRPDGKIDASKLPTIGNKRPIEDWFDEIEGKSP